MQTTLAIVRDEDRKVKVLVLFDSGSHKTLVSLTVRDEFRLEPCCRERLGIMTFGSTNVNEKLRMQLESVEGKKAGILEAYVVDNISEIIMNMLKSLRNILSTSTCFGCQMFENPRRFWRLTSLWG